MILNEGQPEAWRVHSENDASPTLYAERSPAIMSSIPKKTYSLTFPLDFAGTLCARDGIKTGPSTPNGEDAYDRKLVVMKKKRRKVRCYENHQAEQRVSEIEVASTMGASRNANASNNNPLVVTCFSSPQDHCVTRGFMEECAPTINAAAGMSGNNRPFIVKSYGMDPVASYDMALDKEVSKTLICSHGRNCGGALTIRRVEKAYGIDQQGGKGGANYTEDVAPTICSDSHGTPHAVCKVTRTPIVLNFKGSKGNNVVSQDGTCPTINSMHGHDVHVVCVPINSMVIGKNGGNGDRQTFGIGEDGDPSPTLQAAHHHAVAITRRTA